MNSEVSKPSSLLSVIILIALLGLGIFLRLRSFEKLEGVGFDEKIYSRYVEQIGKKGWTHYPEIVDFYIIEQKQAPIAFLPPTRVFFLLSAASWRGLTGLSALESVRSISTAASILFLLGATTFVGRLAGPKKSLVVATLIAFAPLQIYMAHRALIDGFFATVAFFVIWCLWECLQHPKKKRWRIAYGASLALMVLTKENAAFVYMAVLAILAGNHWLKVGTVNKPLLLTSLVGPTVGAGLLVLAAGGAEPLFTAYLLNVRMSYNLPYAIATGDGPWFRYFSDLVLTMPVIVLLAIGGMFRATTTDRAARYFTVFILVSYFIMGNLRYGMNLRYGLIWELPLAYLAATSLFAMANGFLKPARQKVVLTLLVLAVVYLQMAVYETLFVKNEVYDPIPKELNQALNMIK